MEPVLESMRACDLRSGITIYPSQDRQLDQELADLVQDMPANFALLTDSSGQVIGFRGNRGKMDLVALGSLVAGDLAASQAIAQIIREHQDYQLVLRQGQSCNLFLAEAGRHLILLVQAPSEVPLGWSRMLVIETARHLDEILATPPDEDELYTPAIEPDGLQGLVGQALDDLWAN